MKLESVESNGQIEEKLHKVFPQRESFLHVITTNYGGISWQVNGVGVSVDERSAHHTGNLEW